MATTDPTWEAVDEYFTRELGLTDAVLDATIESSASAGLPPISVTATQGKFLQLLAQLVGARRILEIGTLGGYSAIWMARALPSEGQLVSLEINATNAAVAQANIERAGLVDRVRIMVAPAADSLVQLAREGGQPFDLVFIDADKASSDIYLKASLGMTRPGTMIVIDNVVRGGAVVDESNPTPDIQGIRAALATLGSDERLSATALQTVGSKGYDGFVIATVMR